MSRISWGKPRIFVKDRDAGNTAKWQELYTPVEGSTQLSPSKGDRIEARIEGGEYEDVKYKRSTYQVAYNIRKGKEGTTVRRLPFASLDGRVDHHFGFLLQPEDPDCEGFYIEECVVTIDDAYTAEEGGMWQVQMDALKAAAGGDTVKWGKVTITTGTNPTIAFTEISTFDSGGPGERDQAYSFDGASVVLKASTAIEG